MIAPQTLLSLLYHSSVPRYRDEMHVDIELALKRFAIDAELAQLGAGLPSPAEVRAAIEDVDVAAFEIRRAPDSSGRLPGKQHMQAAAARLFGCLAPVLSAEIARGDVPGDQPAAGSGGPRVGLLTQLYLLVYSAEYREGTPASIAFGSESSRVSQSWDAVRAVLRKEAPVSATLPGAVKVLCDQLASDFARTLWPFTW